MRFLWSQVKPFVRGKILFSPDTPAARKIINKINSTFQSFERVKELAAAWTENYSQVVSEVLLDPANQKFLKDFFTSEQNGNLLDLLLQQQVKPQSRQQFNMTDIRETLANFFSGNFRFSHSAAFFRNLINEYFSQTWEKSLESLDKLAVNLTGYLSCVEMDKFEPVETEQMMVKRGLELIGHNKFWAGLVFIDFNKGSSGRKKCLLHIYLGGW